jgi:hypothetical protein
MSTAEPCATTPIARRNPIRAGDHVDPGDARGPGIGFGERREDLHRGRLAGAVGTEKREDAARLDRERQAVERRHPLWIRLHEAVGLDCVFHDPYLQARIRSLRRYLSN